MKQIFQNGLHRLSKYLIRQKPIKDPLKTFGAFERLCVVTGKQARDAKKFNSTPKTLLLKLF